MKKMPHMYLRALSRPHEPGDPPRRWRCEYCKTEGVMDEICKVSCPYDYPPCKHCGLRGECARDCSGMMGLLGGLAAGENPKVHVIGMPNPDLTACKSCLGRGFYPTKNKRKWPKGAKPDEIGYVFVKCEKCGATGKRADAAEA